MREPLAIKTLSQYTESIEAILERWKAVHTTTHLWYRGQARASWDLAPGLYRGGVNPKREREMLRDFKQKARQFLSEPPRSDLEWLFWMQHYGLPTRLLDWTENNLCALYFAVSDYGSGQDACVWILDPWSLNSQAIGRQSVPSTESASLQRWCPQPGAPQPLPAVPVALRPIYSSPRIQAQRGTFTLHGSDHRGIVEQHRNGSLGKTAFLPLPIEGASKKRILGQLFRAGTTAFTLFPDLEGICGEIRFRYSDDYLQTDPGPAASPKSQILELGGATPADPNHRTHPSSEIQD